jgi:hypothetical protein
MFLRDIGIHLHGAWFDYLEGCSYECTEGGDRTFIRHVVTYLQTIWQHFSGDHDLAVSTFMFFNKDIGFIFV